MRIMQTLEGLIILGEGMVGLVAGIAAAHEEATGNVREKRGDGKRQPLRLGGWRFCDPDEPGGADESREVLDG